VSDVDDRSLGRPLDLYAASMSLRPSESRLRRTWEPTPGGKLNPWGAYPSVHEPNVPVNQTERGHLFAVPLDGRNVPRTSCPTKRGLSMTADRDLQIQN